MPIPALRKQFPDMKTCSCLATMLVVHFCTRHYPGAGNHRPHGGADDSRRWRHAQPGRHQLQDDQRRVRTAGISQGFGGSRPTAFGFDSGGAGQARRALIDVDPHCQFFLQPVLSICQS